MAGRQKDDANIPAVSWEDAVKWLRNQPYQEALVKACFFDDPLTEAADRFHACAEYTECRKYIPATPGRALDIGAGRGILSYALAKDGWQVAALEPDPSDLVGHGAIRTLSEQSGVTIEVVDTRGEQIPFGDGTFDLVFCRQVLHHADDLQDLCNEASRVLKSGGTFIATREHVADDAAQLETFLKAHPLHHLYGGEHAFPLEEYQSAITGAGFHLVKVLNPFESAINLFPTTATDVKRAIVKRMRLPSVLGVLVPDAIVREAGRKCAVPGRLYSFVAHKPAEG